MLGQMPDSGVSDNIRKTSGANIRKASGMTKTNTSSQLKKKEGPSSAPSLKKKFEEHGKRRVIDEFLKTAKKPSVAPDLPLKFQTVRERKLTVVNTMRDKPQTLSLDPSAKPDLGDVIIAAAAAKMVKLDPATPTPTSQEFGAQYCRWDVQRPIFCK